MPYTTHEQERMTEAKNTVSNVVAEFGGTLDGWTLLPEQPGVVSGGLKHEGAVMWIDGLDYGVAVSSCGLIFFEGSHAIASTNDLRTAIKIALEEEAGA